VRAEGHALLLVDLPELRQRHDLETTGVGQDRAIPVHELVQTAERRDPLGARPQHQVIRIAEQDFRAGRAHLFGLQPFHRGLGADRHERRRLHPAVRCRELAAARSAVSPGQTEGEGISHQPRNSRQASP
jgi:hypothetical protein